MTKDKNFISYASSPREPSEGYPAAFYEHIGRIDETEFKFLIIEGE